LAVLEDKNLPVFIEQISSASFNLYRDKKHIPKAWKKQLDCLTERFDIANPNEAFSSSCTDFDSLPSRRLELLLISKNIMVLTYDLGQGGAGVVGVIMFCKFSKNKMIDIWTCFTGGKMKSEEDILAYIKKSKDNNLTIHSNFLYF
jgi:hypothetical protein